MKTQHIIGVVVLAIIIAIVLSSAGNTSEYLCFEEARQKAQNGNNDKVHVVGELPRDANGEVVGIEYQPTIDPNYMAFTLVDEKGKKQRVVTSQPPASMADFKRSEKVVVIGNYKGEDFIVKEILLKCPSKYEEKEIKS
jgi:cytochrome c-type biogenesis protein CcmE